MNDLLCCCRGLRRELALVTGRVTAAEVALQQQAADYEARLQQLQTLYSRQTAVVAQLRKGKVPAAVGFRNTNRFWVHHDLLFEFLKHWVVREGLLQQQAGFLGLQVNLGTFRSHGCHCVIECYGVRERNCCTRMCHLSLWAWKHSVHGSSCASANHHMHVARLSSFYRVAP